MDMSRSIYSKFLENYDITSSTGSRKDDDEQVLRRSSNYHPSVWGDHFINVSAQDVKPDPELEKRIETLKADIEKMLSNAAGKAVLEEVTLIDALQSLGVAYHFEDQIKEAIQSIYNNYYIDKNDNDLYTVALRFRILRQQGYNVSSDVFKQFLDDKGEFRSMLRNDVRALLCLFETSHLRVHGEDILEQAFEFSSRNLKEKLPDLSSPLFEQVTHSLEIPLHKRMQRLEARHYISIYEADACRHECLLELAKLDFNRLQTLHRRELSDISRWWKDVDFASKLPFARDRIVECYFWILGVHFEPKYSESRKYMTKIIAIASVIDDIYDVYGTLEELKLFTDAIKRWELVAANDLPEYMKVCYSALFDVVKEMEEKLLNERQSYRACYSKEAIKDLLRAYFVESIWFNTKYVPTFEEYLEISVMSSGYPMLIVQALLGLEDEVATKEAFDWAISVPQIVRSSALIARLVDDIYTYKVEEERGDAPSGVHCYMKEHNVSEEEACKILKEMVDNAWKNINEEIQEPNHLPLQLLLPPLNFARMMEILYQNGDGYTNSSGKTKDRVSSLLVDPISI